MPRAGDRLSDVTLADNFADTPPPLSASEALFEASRCLFCFDAPCTRACPTHIDVPRFIRQVLHQNPLGAAETILSANILGGSCARACPTEVLCEGACVDQLRVKAPIPIGRLQRFACDRASEQNARFFEPGPPTGKRIAIIGSGPAGLSCAHELRKRGHEVILFEAGCVPGGLNTLGIAGYKISTAFALTEVEQVRQLGIEIELNHRVTPAEALGMLGTFDAVFLGIGIGRTSPLEIAGEHLPGVWEALAFIEQTHTKPLAECEVGRHVLVLGAGNTAIDVATAASRLGAERVTVAYRRGPEAMPAFAYEYELAKADGVEFIWHVQPVRVMGRQGAASGVEFVRTEVDDPRSRSCALRLIPSSEFTIEADMVVRALGQQSREDWLAGIPDLRVERGKVWVDPATGATSVPRLFSGGDCLRNGGEIVDAVQDGKIAAQGIHALLTAAKAV